MDRRGFKKGGEDKETLGSGAPRPFYNRLGKRSRLRDRRIVFAILFLLSVLLPASGWGGVAVFYVLLSLLSLTGLLVFLPRGFEPEKIIGHLQSLGENIEGWSSYSSRVPLIVLTRDGVQAYTYLHGTLYFIATEASGHLPTPMGERHRPSFKPAVDRKKLRRSLREGEPMLIEVEMTMPSIRSPHIFTRYRGRAAVLVRRAKRASASSYAEELEAAISAFRGATGARGFL